MAHEPVGAGCTEGERAIFLSAQMEPYLAQTEQIKVVDEEGRDQHQPPADAQARRARPGRPGPARSRHATKRLPVANKHDQRDARKQHVGAALGRLGDEPCPPALERRPRHDAVLQGEQSEQQCIDQQCLTQRALR